jgi:hypothetical protein
MTDPDLRRVTLADVPVDTFWRMHRHQEDMLREFALIDVARRRGDVTEVPERLLQIVTDLNTRLAAPREVFLEAMEAAAAEGAATATVIMRLPVAAAAAVDRTCAAYEDADEYCRNGDLLTMATPADIALFRRRLCADIVEQLSG